MRSSDVHDDLKNSNRHIVAKPLAETVKISPKNSMVMFNLNGTLMRNGVLLRKILSRTSQVSVDKAFDIHTEVERTPIADYLNRVSIDTSQKLEEHIKNNKFPPDVHNLFLPEHIIPIIENAINPDDAEKFLDEDKTKEISLKIAQNIHDMLIKDTQMKALLEKSFDIYDKQTTIGSQKIIMPEITNMINNMAALGVPIAIVSNKTQDFVTQAFNRIFETLTPENQKKWHDKEWHFAKIGVQRDDDGDVIQPVKPAADLLISSHTKAEKFNLKNNREPIKNVVFVGNSETFDMRAADNLQRSDYAVDNGINVYKLLCRYDDPTKKVNDEALINNKSAFKHITDVNQRLSTVFDTPKNI